jgi:serine/threonine protein kinase
VHVGRCLCNALDHLHQLPGDDGKPLGLVHRDITPANVFVIRTGEVKLADFGVAWRKDDPEAVIAGTPEFAAPEQQQSADLDARTDIYGLGATLRAVAAEFPADLAAILERACAADRQARFPNAKALATALGELSPPRSSLPGQHPLADLCAELWADRPANSRHAPQLDAPVQAILADALTSDGKTAAAPLLRRRRWSLRLVPAALAAAGLAALAWQLGRPPGVEPVVSPEPGVTRIEPVSEARSAKPPRVGVQNEPQAAVAPSPARKRPVNSRGTVNLNATPWAQVKIDGRDIGNTPLKGILLAAGRHTITLSNPPQNLHRKIVIEVDANCGQTFLIDLRRGIVQKRHDDDRS